MPIHVQRVRPDKTVVTFIIPDDVPDNELQDYIEVLIARSGIVVETTAEAGFASEKSKPSKGINVVVDEVAGQVVVKMPFLSKSKEDGGGFDKEKVVALSNRFMNGVLSTYDKDLKANVFPLSLANVGRVIQNALLITDYEVQTADLISWYFRNSQHAAPQPEPADDPVEQEKSSDNGTPPPVSGHNVPQDLPPVTFSPDFYSHCWNEFFAVKPEVDLVGKFCGTEEATLAKLRERVQEIGDVKSLVAWSKVAFSYVPIEEDVLNRLIGEVIAKVHVKIDQRRRLNELVVAELGVAE